MRPGDNEPAGCDWLRSIDFEDTRGLRLSSAECASLTGLPTPTVMFGRGRVDCRVDLGGQTGFVSMPDAVEASGRGIMDGGGALDGTSEKSNRRAIGSHLGLGGGCVNTRIRGCHPVVWVRLVPSASSPGPCATVERRGGRRPAKSSLMSTSPCAHEQPIARFEGASRKSQRRPISLHDDGGKHTELSLSRRVKRSSITSRS